MATEARTLTIHCSGPAPLVPGAAVPGAMDGVAVDLWYAQLDRHRQHLEQYAALLDPVEQERAARFRFAVDRERFTIAHGLLRTLLGQRLDERPEALRFTRAAFGKPAVEGAGLRFNLSDTKDALLIGISDGREIGVDIETMARTVDHLAVGAHYFTGTEVAGIQQATDAKRRFLELWTRKEAVLKASGVGIMDDLRVLQVDAEVNRLTIRHEAFVAHAADAYHLGTWHLGAEHIISVASERPLGPVVLGEV